MPKKKTLEEFKNEVKKLFNDEYSVIGDYKNNKVKILMRHNKCKTNFFSIPKDFLKKKGGCPLCARKKLSLEILKKEMPDNYEYISGFKSYKTYCNFKHTICGYEFSTTPSYLVRGRGCPKCGGTKRKTNEEFLEEIKKFPDSNEYFFLESYINDRTKIKVKHITCGYEYMISPSCFLRGRRCPSCDKRNSYAIKSIKNILDKNNIQYKTEYAPGLKGNGNGYLKYDIFIPSKNLLIEFDGEQHFRFVFHTSLEKFKIQHKYDIIKNDYIKNTKYTLIRIPYRHNVRVSRIMQAIIDKKSSETIEKFKLYLINKDQVIENNYYEEYNKNLVEYTQVSGSGEFLEKGKDIVQSI